LHLDGDDPGGGRELVGELHPGTAEPRQLFTGSVERPDVVHAHGIRNCFRPVTVRVAPAEGTPARTTSAPSTVTASRSSHVAPAPCFVAASEPVPLTVDVHPSRRHVCDDDRFSSSLTHWPVAGFRNSGAAHGPFASNTRPVCGPDAPAQSVNETVPAV